MAVIDEGMMAIINERKIAFINDGKMGIEGTGETQKPDETKTVRIHQSMG